MIARLCIALNVHTPELFADITHPIEPIARHAEQPVWRDSETGMIRRAVSPGHGRCASNTDLMEVELPAGRGGEYGPQQVAGVHWHFWVLEGEVTVMVDDQPRILQEGDCTCAHAPCRLGLRNDSARSAHFLVVITRN